MAYLLDRGRPLQSGATQGRLHLGIELFAPDKHRKIVGKMDPGGVDARFDRGVFQPHDPPRRAQHSLTPRRAGLLPRAPHDPALYVAVGRPVIGLVDASDLVAVLRQAGNGAADPPECLPFP